MIFMVKKKIKILLINERHYNSGGAEKQFFILKKSLQKRKFIVHSIGFGPKNILGKDYLILKESKYPIIREIYRNLLHPMNYFRMRNYIKKFNPDIIHLHNINNYTPTIIKSIKDYKIVCTLHDYSLFCPEGWNIHNDGIFCVHGFSRKCWLKHKRSSWPIFLSKIITYFIKKHFFKKKVSLFITPTPILHKLVIDLEYNNVVYISNMLDYSNFFFLDKSIKDHLYNRKYILYVGSLEKNKGVMQLLEEYYLAKQKFETYRKISKSEAIFLKLVIVGKGSLYSKLQNFVKLNGMNNEVIFKGWSDNTTKYYIEAMFVVIPSLCAEQFGMVAAEAMMHSVAVVGSDVGGLSWLIKNGDTGILFNPRTQGVLSENILQLISNKTLTHTMGIKGYKRIRKLISNKKSIDILISKYNDLLQ